MALEDMRSAERGADYAGEATSDHEQDAFGMADLEKAASAALEKAETFIKENPVAAAIGIGAAGAMIAFAISRRTRSQPLDRRLLNELNRHSEDVVRAVRRNANSFANSDTAQAVEGFVSNLVSSLVKVPDAVSKQVSNLTK